MPRISTAFNNHYGIGDLACLAWLAEATRDTKDPITFFAHRGTRYDILKLMGQEVTDDPAGVGVCIYTAYQNELADSGRRSRLAYIADVLGIPYRFKRPTVRFSDEDLKWAREVRGDNGDDFIMLFPQTCWKPREWPSSYWVDLGWRLKNDNIHAAFFMGDKDERFTNTPKYFWGYSFGQLSALMSISQMVIGVDSGPAHVAGTVGVPTIALCGPTRPECVFAHMPDVIPMTAHEDPDCTGCHFKAPFRAACDQGCQMLFNLKPQIVYDEIRWQLDARRRRNQA